MNLVSGDCIFVTGGAGFIGSAVIRELIRSGETNIVNIDSLTYAGNLETVSNISNHERYCFSHTDIRDRDGLQRLFEQYQPAAVMHLAAESHVDRSIDGPKRFIETNVLGTCILLEVVRSYLESLDKDRSNRFRFHHISTDEVFGSLGDEGSFSEDSSYQPRSPYAASKAASDHLVRAWGATYGIPTIISNCSNNYGPYQYPEKLIPVVIRKALEGETIPLYGSGENVRDWLYVVDHARALILVLQEGLPGRTYNIGGGTELTNFEVVKLICEHLDRMCPRNLGQSHAELISFVRDRPGHDFRYAIDSSRIQNELGWKPRETFSTGIEKTIAWYLENRDWVDTVLEDQYEGQRLGLGDAA